jgi:putative long chain acyl-CoA synthase
MDDLIERVGAGARNAFEILSEGRLGAPYRAPFEVVSEHDVFELRHYHPDEADADAPPVLLVPPLMVKSEIYDISPELSAINLLVAEGVDVWLVDYGAPETREDGLERNLDDHIVGVDTAIDEVRERTGRDVHLAGYSQGGMFGYQAAAYRRSEGLASLITFGSPVDIRRNLPVEIHDETAERIIKLAHRGFSNVLDELDALPGSITSRGFKLLNPGKELKHLVDFIGVLHDREEVEEREPKRAFLDGEGFVAWPGEALRDFIDTVVVDNRLAEGGFVVGDRTISLADIDVPIFYFAGTRDDLARPEAVEGIEEAAPDASTHGCRLSTGHFGLVVGSKAVGTTWPSVARWVHWHEGDAEPPAVVETSLDERDDSPASNLLPYRDDGARAMYDLATELVDGLWHRLGDVSREVGGIVDALRWQLPRFARLDSLRDDQRVNLGRALSEQARAIPEETFFLWKDRAFSYREADERVSSLGAAMLDDGLRPDDHVGVLMDNHPDFLTAVAAANRIGAVSVLLNSGMRGMSLEQALEAGEVDRLVTDAAHVEDALEAFDGPIGVLEGAESVDSLPDGVCDLERALNEQPPEIPLEWETDAGRADELAMLVFTSGTTGLPKPARITNRRWALAALGTAAACELTPDDTVYCALPLYHATGMLVAVGGALVGGARLALAPTFSVERFWDEVRRYGGTVVFYVGEMCRYLVNAPETPNEDAHPVEMFVGNGLRPDVWERLLDRFGPVDVLEFYGSTEGNVCLANLTGDKIGSIGRPLPGTNEVMLVAYDASSGRPERGSDGFVREVDDGEPGLLLARIGDDHPLAHFDGYLDEEETERKIVRDALELGDAWFNTGDVLRCDEEGDYWFVDRVGDTFRWRGENVSTEQVARVVRRASFCSSAVVYGVEVPGHEGRAGAAAIVLEDGSAFEGDTLYELVGEHLFEAARPRFVRIVDDLETNDAFKYLKRQLQRDGVDPRELDDPLYYYDDEAETYAPLTADVWRSRIRRAATDA